MLLHTDVSSLLHGKDYLRLRRRSTGERTRTSASTGLLPGHSEGFGIGQGTLRMRLKGQRTVVLGGTSGMGLAIAELAKREGASVVVAGNSPEGAQKAKAALGGEVEALSFDVGDEAAVKDAFDGIGPFDHLVTTAAKLTYAPLGELPVAAVTEMLASKFWGPFFAARSASKLLKPGGSITFFSGLAADRPGPGTSIVSAVNAGLEGFARALAVELAPLRVNCVSPGVTQTAGWNFMTEDDRKAFFDGLRKSLPTRRVGQPEDLAEATLALMTNPFITGTVLHCDGGGHLS